MRVLVAGDVHGALDDFAHLVETARRKLGCAAVLQVGDFGFYADFLGRFEKARRPFALPVYAIDGNHEDHQWLARELRCGALSRWRKQLNLHYQPRPSIARIGGSVIGFLGGALNVDRPQEIDSRARTSNFVLRRERKVAVELFNRIPPDLLVTHTCPAGIGIGIRADPGFASEVTAYVLGAGFDPGPPHDCGDSELATLWQRLKLQPKAWVFGHFHVCHSVLLAGTRFLCPGCARRPGIRSQNSAVWDTEAKQILML
jgi:predicted phosphodiesterase